MSETKDLDDILGVTESTEDKKADTKKDNKETKDASKTTSASSSAKSSSKDKEKDTKDSKKADAKSVDKAEADVAEESAPSQESENIEGEGKGDAGKVEQSTTTEDAGAESQPVPETAKVEEPTVASVQTEQSNEEVKEGNTETTEKASDIKYDSEDSESYPKRLKLVRPTTVYRGPNDSLAGKSFGGTVEITGPTTIDGFTPVTFVRAGFGVVKGYIRLPKKAVK